MCTPASASRLPSLLAPALLVLSGGGGSSAGGLLGAPPLHRRLPALRHRALPPLRLLHEDATVSRWWGASPIKGSDGILPAQKEDCSFEWHPIQQKSCHSAEWLALPAVPRVWLSTAAAAVCAILTLLRVLVRSTSRGTAADMAGDARRIPAAVCKLSNRRGLCEPSHGQQ